MPSVNPDWAEPAEELPEPRPPFGIGVWAVACAACAGIVWPVGWCVATRFIPGPDPFGVLLPLPRALPNLAGIGAGWGFFVGLLAGLVLHRWSACLLWGVASGTMTAGAAVLAVVAVPLVGGVVPPWVSSSLGFATAGFLSGAACYLWSFQRRRPAGRASAGGGVAFGTRYPRPIVARPLLRALAVILISVASLAGACVLAPTHALPFLTVGLLGLSVSWVLWGQERRLQDLERRFRSESHE